MKFFSYTLRSHHPVVNQKMFKEKSDSKLHRHHKETTFQTCNNATGNKALEWVLILLFHYKQDRKQDKLRMFSKTECKLSSCTPALLTPLLPFLASTPCQS